MHVLVLAGGLSPERDVSNKSGRRVAEALRQARPDWEVNEGDVDASLLERLSAHRPDCVIPMLHGVAGEDGSLFNVLEAMDLPFVGPTGSAARVAFDKAIAKELVRSAGLLTPAAVAMPQSIFRDLGAKGLLDAVVDHLGLPLVVKPTKGGSSLGTSIVQAAEELPSAMVGAFAYGDVVMIEQFIAGTEVSIGVFEHSDDMVALSAVEIVPEGEMFDYTARYTAGTTEFFCPARLSEHETEVAQAMALNVHLLLELRDWSRTDIIVDSDGQAWFLEVNVVPGMTETSLFPQALSAAEMSLGEVVADLVESAISR